MPIFRRSPGRQQDCFLNGTGSGLPGASVGGDCADADMLIATARAIVVIVATAMSVLDLDMDRPF